MGWRDWTTGRTASRAWRSPSSSSPASPGGTASRFTARDIAFTWKLGSDPGSGFSNFNPWNRATGVEVVDHQTAVLHLDRVRADFNKWDHILPEHIEGPVLAKAGASADYISATTYNRVPLTPGLYGPYMITGYDSGSQIVLEPNPHWVGTKPGFKRIVLRHIETTAALQANLRSGDVDMVAGEGIGLTIDQALALQKQHPDCAEVRPSTDVRRLGRAAARPEGGGREWSHPDPLHLVQADIDGPDRITVPNC